MSNIKKFLMPKLILALVIIFVAMVLLMWFAWPEIGPVGLAATIVKSALVILLIIGLVVMLGGVMLSEMRSAIQKRRSRDAQVKHPFVKVIALAISFTAMISFTVWAVVQVATPVFPCVADLNSSPKEISGTIAAKNHGSSHSRAGKRGYTQTWDSYTVSLDAESADRAGIPVDYFRIYSALISGSYEVGDRIAYAEYPNSGQLAYIELLHD